MLASQRRRSGRNLLIIAAQPGEAKNRWSCEFRKESVNDFFYCALSRVVIGRRHRAMLGRNLR